MTSPGNDKDIPADAVDQDMISSYADIKQTPCAECNQLTNNAAQLPTIRRQKPSQSSEGEQKTFTFDALHADCA